MSPGDPPDRPSPASPSFEASPDLVDRDRLAGALLLREAELPQALDIRIARRLLGIAGELGGIRGAGIRLLELGFSASPMRILVIRHVDILDRFARAFTAFVDGLAIFMIASVPGARTPGVSSAFSREMDTAYVKNRRSASAKMRPNKEERRFRPRRNGSGAIRSGHGT